MLRVIEYLANSLKVTQGQTIAATFSLDDPVVVSSLQQGECQCMHQVCS